MRNFILLVLLGIVFSSCKTEQSGTVCDMDATNTLNQSKATITTGIWGTVSFQQGNCIPSPVNTPTCQTCPVLRNVLIYEYTKVSDAKVSGVGSGFYSSFNTVLVKEVIADDNGFFQAELPAGKYTVVVSENGLLYSSIRDGDNGINPVTVGAGRQKFDFLINYNAIY